MNAKALELKDISLNRGYFRLQGINAEFPPGRITAVVGPNGSGKSTLLRTMTRLIGVDSGEVLIHEKPASAFSPRQLAQHISMLPQAKDSMPDLTVRELVSYGRAPYKKLFHQRHTKEDKRAIDFAIEATCMSKHVERLYYTLSGGEQQRARIAMALAQGTDILLLDEPTTYLDIAHQLEILNMLKRINEHMGITIVMVLHDLQQAAAYGHHMIAMKRGIIAAAGHPSALLTPAFLKEIYDIDAKVMFIDGYPLIIPMAGIQIQEEL
ncbi:ABC transporter ATP-binding protein [Paenibacillus sp. P96]|uniref:ABC transporter ATP-binding protein n=1 Tax=Paenibacillus zeirhizosphaerae TaxID=2987519 RepID=A0ABT9FR25_9BACL|nr:ABC transporter ATP-binding protein [Paenibacillus sp. P96]MDP4097176.1 ABC transporter ATP-binding protein [Paenibacillus sp. P96]